MFSQDNCGNPKLLTEAVTPIAIKAQNQAQNTEHLLNRDPGAAVLLGKGAYVVLDFGKEVCAGIYHRGCVPFRRG